MKEIGVGIGNNRQGTDVSWVPGGDTVMRGGVACMRRCHRDGDPFASHASSSSYPCACVAYNVGVCG